MNLKAALFAVLMIAVAALMSSCDKSVDDDLIASVDAQTSTKMVNQETNTRLRANGGRYFTARSYPQVAQNFFPSYFSSGCNVGIWNDGAYRISITISGSLAINNGGIESFIVEPGQNRSVYFAGSGSLSMEYQTLNAPATRFYANFSGN